MERRLSLPFASLNRNKRSVTINLKSNEGRALFYELVKKSDIVVNNFSAGVPERLGISYRHLSELNPGIITASIMGFGETGPGRDRVAFDMVAQASGGGLSITGHPEGNPVRAGIPVGDLGGGEVERLQPGKPPEMAQLNVRDV